MEKQKAREWIKKVFNDSFDEHKFRDFMINFLPGIDENRNNQKKWQTGNYVPEAYRSHIRRFKRLGQYTDPDGELLDVLLAEVTKHYKLERTRGALRNFAIHYLKGKKDSRDTVLIAYFASDYADWRLSYIKITYTPIEKNNKITIEKEITYAKRYSFLVGKNEPNHTAQQYLLPLLTVSSKPYLKDIEDAFNIEKVTEEFFEKYRDLFILVKDELEKIVQKDAELQNAFQEKAINTVDFTKKLLGQIVFLYFLQKKGWFGVRRNKRWDTDSKRFLRELFEKKHKNFFNDILEPLFYEALSLEHQDNYYSRFNCKIPFLNGGLFDPMGGYDWVHRDIQLPNELFSNNEITKEGDKGTGILDIFDRYNFTVQEDEPLDKEVAIDPELLGKAYEKLNAIRPDNYEEFKKALKSNKKGEKNKFNKKYGVYYTPREIVHYMCKESLINYLLTEADKNGLKINEQDIRTLIDQGGDFTENEQVALEKEIYIQQGKQQRTEYKSKLSDNIRSNAQFIDDKLAEITICDPAVGSGAFPVGMMNEIVKARDVLSVYIKNSQQDERKVYALKSWCIEHSLYGVDIDPGAVEVAKLRLWLSLMVDEDDIKNIKALPNLDYKIMQGNSLLRLDKYDLFNDQLLRKIEGFKIDYLKETNVKGKEKIKKEIDQRRIQITKGSDNFIFEVDFSEVFRIQKGFDLVIANPPYVPIPLIPKNEKSIYDKFQSAKGRFNLFYFFLEITRGITKPEAISSFIVPDRLLLNTQCNELRKLLLEKQCIIEIDSFDQAIFEAVVDSVVIIYKNHPGISHNIKVKNRVSLDQLKETEPKMVPISHFSDPMNQQFNLEYNPQKNTIIRKIQNKSVLLKEIADVKDGIIQGKVKDRLFLEKPLDDDSKPLLMGKDITKYAICFKKRYVNYKPSEMMKLEREGGGEPGLRMRKPKIFERSKILTRQTADKLIAAYDDQHYYYANTLHGTTIKDKYFDPLYLLAILNSKLMVWYYRSTTEERGKVFAQVKIEILKKIPILNIVKTQQQPFIDLAHQIITTKEKASDADTAHWEKQIDQLIYQLYQLTSDEVKMVEGS